MANPTRRPQSAGTDTQAKTLGLKEIKTALDAAALVYDVDEHGPLEPIAAYHSPDGVLHQVCINRHPDLDWRVIDSAATLVGRLDGADDLRSAAVSYAKDYARQCRLYHAGTREDPPLLRPKTLQMRKRPQSPTTSLRPRSGPALDGAHSPGTSDGA